MRALKPLSKYSEGSWGLSVQVRVAGIFTGTAISPSPGRMKLPVLMVNPKNDPFLAGDCYPVDFAKHSPHLFLEMPESGGHCGFITPGRNNLWWPAKRALDFLTPLIK